MSSLPLDNNDIDLPELEELEFDDDDNDNEVMIPCSTPLPPHLSSIVVPSFYKYPKIYVPPLNFSVVEDGIYRSGHPIKINFDFLARLNLQTIIYLGDKEDQCDYYRWLKNQNIKFHYIKTESSSEPFVMNNPDSIVKALNLIVDKKNFPILVHSNKGKHRVGVLVGIMRKILQGWSLSGIFDEYVKFAGGKGEADLEFMELFNPQLQLNLQHKPEFVRID
ncbi:Oca2 protein [Saccharomycopsis crataegensis]|uniref:Oca2 protein n=1 Tax=Saccharomycopsis crataegensis TaxID=43959 RepID=A0AAV5QV69_9ASCO|nr:Oca2 protein [Saccharomycopsis crataegensis]